MAKFYGSIGYVVSEETAPGVMTDIAKDRKYYGDIIQTSRSLQSSDQLNDNVVLNNELSIIADPFAYQNFQSFRYVEFMGSKWKITKVTVRYPRLILTLGGVWNGEQA